MHWLTQIFLFAVVTSTLVKYWLSLRQTRAVMERSSRVPAPFAEQISLADHSKAANYTVAGERVGRIDLLLDTALLLGFTLGGGIDALDRFWQWLHLGSPWHGTLVVISVLLLQTVIALPLSIWRTFGIEARFGFNRTTGKLFATDLLKELLVMLLLGGPLLCAVLFLMDSAGNRWWLYTWVLWSVFSVLLNWAWPAFIAPLFNKFSPLADESVLARITALLARCGFKSQGVFVMDGSRRSSHGNAYFTGFGKSKRVVFFDTLLQHLSAAEIEAILAHELGHYRRHHIRNRLLFSLVVSFLGLGLLGLLSAWPEFYGALGVDQPSSHAALLLFMLASSPAIFWLTPLGAWWSRRQEFEADEFAADHANARELISALTKLYRDNATTLTPDSLHSSFYDSHPTALVRIDRLRMLAARA